MVRLRPAYRPSATLAEMDEERIVAAAEQAARHGGPVAAVLPMRTTGGAVRFACALQREGGGLAWVVLDEAGEPLVNPGEIRSVAETIAICETAEESGAMLAAVEADGLLQQALELVGDDETVAVALRAMREAIAPLLQTEEGVRVAEPGYLDRVAVTAAMVGDRFDYLKDVAYGVSAKLSGAPARRARRWPSRCGRRSGSWPATARPTGSARRWRVAWLPPRPSARTCSTTT